MLGEGRIITTARRGNIPSRSSATSARSADCAESPDVAAVAQHLEVSEQASHWWRAQFGGLKADDARRLKELEAENARLKRIVADKELAIEVEDWNKEVGT